MRLSDLLRLLLLFVTCSLAKSTWRDLAYHFPAPLLGIDYRDRVPNQYAVALPKDHTLEQHLEFIGQNLTGFERFLPSISICFATMDDELRELVRRDSGVRFVEVDTLVHAIEPVECMDMGDQDVADFYLTGKWKGGEAMIPPEWRCDRCADAGWPYYEARATR